MMASSDDLTMDDEERVRRFLRTCSVTSRVKHCVWTKRPSSHRTLESMSTFRTSPDLAPHARRILAAAFSAPEAGEDVRDDLCIDMELGDRVTDVLVGAVSPSICNSASLAQRIVPSGPTRCSAIAAVSRNAASWPDCRRTSASLARRAARARE